MNSTNSTLCWKRVTIPKGLPALLEILAKETIRENPTNIVEFLNLFLDDLIAKRDSDGTTTEQGESEKKNLLKAGNKPGSYTFNDEELAASKIQAGFRGYKTRKTLKSKKNKGGDLSLTSLIPFLNNTENENRGANDEEVEKRRMEKEEDEAIAAEIKTPLETIREESMDGSSRVKTPECKIPYFNTTDKTVPEVNPEELIEALEEISEEQEKINLHDIYENESEELGNVSLDDAKTESLEMEVEQDGSNFIREGEESDADREMMEHHVNEVLNMQELGEDDQTSLGTADVKGASLEIHESEVETMILEEESVVNDGESETGIEIGEIKDLNTALGENLEVSEDKVLKAEVVDYLNPDETMDQPSSKSETNYDGKDTNNVEIYDDEEVCNENNINNSELNIELSTFQEHDEQFTDREKSNTFDEKFDDTESIGGTKEKVKDEDEQKDEAVNLEEQPSESDDKTGIYNVTVYNDIHAPHLNSVDVEMSSLVLCDQSDFSNTVDSASSSATTVRPLDFEKREDSSQDASSLSENPVVPPRPKPRKPAASVESADKSSIEEPGIDSEKTLLTESKEDIENLQPVLLRQKSAPKNRGRAVSSKYRSGIVMDEEVSMEEMEAQIENDMLSQAATKIQAGFRGYKTRKNMGVSAHRVDRGSGKKNAKLISNEEEITPANAVAPSPSTPSGPAAGSVFATAYASADNLDYVTEQGKKPSLSYLRSRSYPGSHEEKEEPESCRTVSKNNEESGAAVNPHESNVELDYDPAYVNNAAIKIQASVRGYLVRNQNKKRGIRKVQDVPRVQFAVGDEQEENQELPNYGDFIINPAERDMRDSASPVSDVGSDVAATKIQAAFRGFKDRQKVRQTKKAVVTIQATVRGFLTRRRLMKLRRRSLQRRRSSAKSMMSPEVQKIKKANDAATKIQAVYRGYQVRSKIRKGGIDD